MNHTNTTLEAAEQYCIAHGSKLTTKRKQVLTALIESSKALSAYELVDICNQKLQASLPAMTVYRILDFLENAGLVHKLNLANKYVACSHISCDHSHGTPQFLICKTCSAVNEVSISNRVIAELTATVEQANYQLLSPQIELNCLCQQCADSN